MIKSLIIGSLICVCVELYMLLYGVNAVLYDMATGWILCGVFVSFAAAMVICAALCAGISIAWDLAIASLRIDLEFITHWYIYMIPTGLLLSIFIII